jgi:hypothetical protein
MCLIERRSESFLFSLFGEELVWRVEEKEKSTTLRFAFHLDGDAAKEGKNQPITFKL